jgi:hypothetical protein
VDDKDHPDSTHEDLSVISGVRKARVCQMVALYDRLPARITDYLMNTDEPEILKHFTERRLRPLTLLASEDEKLKKLDEMVEAILIGYRKTVYLFLSITLIFNSSIFLDCGPFPSSALHFPGLTALLRIYSFSRASQAVLDFTSSMRNRTPSLSDGFSQSIR